MNHLDFFKTHIKKFRRGSNNQATGQCPLHEDKTPSFSCNVKDGVWKCHGCGKSGNIYKLAQELGIILPDEKKSFTDLIEIARYLYTDEKGNPLIQVRRYFPKTFRQFKYNNGKWISGTQGTRRMLYKLPELLDQTTVHICEGEKDCETLLKFGIPATCNIGGAGKWRDEYSEVLRGKCIIIWPDQDAIGLSHADQVAKSLWGRAKEIKIVNPLQGKDVSAWIESGATKDDLITLVQKTASLLKLPNNSNSDLLQKSTTQTVFVRLSEVKPEPILWLWPQRIAKGKLTLLVGDPGLGKSFITLDIASRLSRGADWPDVPHTEQGPVIILSAEDGIADTIRPRLDALGGGSENIYILQAIRQGDQEKSISLTTDLRSLESFIQEVSAKLIVIDPLSAYLGRTDSRMDSEVRGVLGPIASLAERTGTAILGVMHLNKASDKRAIYRTNGSIGFVGAARIVMMVAKDQTHEERRFLGIIKTNLSSIPDTLAFAVNNGVLEWESNPIYGLDFESLLSTLPNSKKGEERTEAANFLAEILANGEMKATEVINEAKLLGIRERTLKRAKALLKIVTSRKGFTGSWFWSLPLPKGATNDNVAFSKQDTKKTEEITGSSPKDVNFSDEAPFGEEIDVTRNQTEPENYSEVISKNVSKVFPGAKGEVDNDLSV